MNIHRLAMALMLLVGSAPAVAGTPQVYDLDAGPGAEKDLLFTSSESVNLQIDLGTVLGTGTPCVDGTGDHLCAAEVVVSLDGPGVITAFSPGAGVVFEPDPVVPTGELRLNVLQSLSPPAPGEQGLGTVYIDNTAQTTSNVTKVEVSGSVVDATGQLRTISTTTVAVPEPASTLLLVSGVLGLGALHRWRLRGGDSGR